MKTLTLLFAVAFVAACNSVHSNGNNQAKTSTPAVSPVVQTTDSVRRVTTAELEALMKEGKVIVVDVRNKAMFDIGHIRGAKLIPVGEVANRANELPKDKTIVTYCS